MSANGQAELDELDADELADLDELPVELQDTWLRTIITPTRRGGERAFINAVGIVRPQQC